MKIRATSRMARVSALTTGMLAELVLRQRLSPARAEQLARSYKQTWARRLMRNVGLHVEVHGGPPAQTRGLLVVSNHRSYIDIPVLMTQLDCAILSKAEVAKWPVFGVAARSVGTLFVDRSSPESRAATLEAVGHRLQQGQTVLVFPEGTTTPSPDIDTFRKGLFVLAARMDVPILPVALHYAERRLEWVGDDEFLPHFLRNFSHKGSHVHVSFGPVLRDGTGMDLRQQAEDWVRRRVGELQAGHFSLPTPTGR